jgi:DNA invertase Pin-like site-specific DNA recombinase
VRAANAKPQGEVHASRSAARAPLPSRTSAKIRDTHLDKLAIVYVRQSSPQQVVENRESTARQYALVDFAKALGWPGERVLLIDEDQGQSGSRAENRGGFQRLLAEVTLDHVGLVLSLEMSRLARSCKDWHHLLEACAIFGSLLADQDGVYDPQDANDRLLLGLKGTMSEVELHTMRNRLERGRLNKAQRGELFYMRPWPEIFPPSGEPQRQRTRTASKSFVSWWSVSWFTCSAIVNVSWRPFTGKGATKAGTNSRGRSLTTGSYTTSTS